MLLFFFSELGPLLHYKLQANGAKAPLNIKQNVNLNTLGEKKTSKPKKDAKLK